MKVKGINSSSKKTRKLIKETFAELINEKKELSKITVTELVKRAEITRSTFYTHYDDLYDVSNDYQLETIESLVSNDKILYDKNDIIVYFTDIIDFLKKNEKIYKMLLSAPEPLIFLEKLKIMVSKKILFALQDFSKDNIYLDLDVSFFMNGFISELLKYFRDASSYTLEQLQENLIKWFNKIF